MMKKKPLKFITESLREIFIKLEEIIDWINSQEKEAPEVEESEQKGAKLLFSFDDELFAVMPDHRKKEIIKALKEMIKDLEQKYEM